MIPRLVFLSALSGLSMVALACTRTSAIETSRPPPTPLPAAMPETSKVEATDAAVEVALPLDAAVTSPVWTPAAASAIDGPHEELSLDAGRPIYYALPKTPSERPMRLVGHLHGMCGPPPYACGKWIGAGTEVGAMICPTGNARCGDSPYAPPSWEAPTWTELVGIMDADLESAVRKVETKRPGTIRRDGAVLTGYSRGAYATPVIARRHPNRWPYLVLIEANVPLTAEGLRASGVRAVALVAGEQGTEIAGMQKTLASLEASGFPAKLFVMRRTGHLYSDDMEYVMHAALEFVLAHGDREETTDAGVR